jgi:hypothetical protein
MILRLSFIAPFMKADWRTTIKDYRQNANFKKLWSKDWRLPCYTIAQPIEFRWIPNWKAIQRLGLCRFGFPFAPCRRPQSSETLFWHGLSDPLADVAACTSRAATSLPQEITRPAISHWVSGTC